MILDTPVANDLKKKLALKNKKNLLCMFTYEIKHLSV